MNRQGPYQAAISNFQAYLNCASILMFVLCTGVLIATYSAMHWISVGDLTGVPHQSNYMFVLLLSAALIISGIQITLMWADQSTPSILELTLFCALHVVAFLTSYLVMGVTLTVIKSPVIPVACILGAITVAYVCFIRTRDKFGQNGRQR